MNATPTPCPKDRTIFGLVPTPLRMEAPGTASTVPVTGEPIPSLDLQNLLDIVADTGNPDFAVDFLDDYMLLLHVRVSRILAAVEVSAEGSRRHHTGYHPLISGLTGFRWSGGGRLDDSEDFALGSPKDGHPAERAVGGGKQDVGSKSGSLRD